MIKLQRSFIIHVHLRARRIQIFNIINISNSLATSLKKLIRSLWNKLLSGLSPCAFTNKHLPSDTYGSTTSFFLYSPCLWSPRVIKSLHYSHIDTHVLVTLYVGIITTWLHSKQVYLYRVTKYKHILQHSETQKYDSFKPCTKTLHKNLDLAQKIIFRNVQFEGVSQLYAITRDQLSKL